MVGGSDSIIPSGGDKICWIKLFDDRALYSNIWLLIDGVLIVAG